jgi:hypothetical protein
MRACFLGRNVCALGYGVATLQTPPLHDPQADEKKPASHPPSFPAVLPADGHEYGRPPFYPLHHPLTRL